MALHRNNKSRREGKSGGHVGTRLETAHSLIARAGFYIVMQIVRRKFTKSGTATAVHNLRSAIKELDPLISDNDQE